MRIEFATVPGRVYRVECCEDLALNQWTVLFDDIAGTGDPWIAIDPSGKTLPKCFYRVVITAP